MNTLAVVAVLAAAATAPLVLPARPGRRLRNLARPGADRDQRSGPAGSRPPAAGFASAAAGLLPAQRGQRGRARASPIPGALVLDLVAAVLDGGAAPVTAVQRVGAALTAVADPAAQALDRCGWALTAAGPSPRAPAVAAGRGERPAGADGGSLEAALTEALLLATSTGLAPAPLVRRAAGRHRRRSALASSAAAQRLGVLLMLPTGVCLLPAFALLGLAPLAIDLFAQVAPALG